MRSFTGSNGASPVAPLIEVIEASDTFYYGTTRDGGVYGVGTVYRLAQDGTLTTLHSFGGGDGSRPQAGLIEASDGYFYGTTYLGGAYCPYSGCGTVFRVDRFGNLSTLRSFNSSDGLHPQAALVEASDGYLYGTTLMGGAYGAGTVFKLAKNGSNFTTLHSFTGTSGRNPRATLVDGGDGFLYGTTSQGGADGLGTAFKIGLSGGLITLRSFSGLDGARPYAALVEATDECFYGTTREGGQYSTGTVFRLCKNGSFATMLSFSPFLGYPTASLLQASDGDLYGTVTEPGDGLLFKVDLETGNLYVLHSLSYDGAEPSAALIQASDRYLYGTTEWSGPTPNSIGTVYRFGPINRPPVLEPAGNWTVAEGQTLELWLSATDPDGDLLTYSLDSHTAPPGAGVDPATGHFLYTPDFDVATPDANTVFDVVFRVEDEYWGSSSHTSRVTVMSACPPITVYPPSLNPVSMGQPFGALFSANGATYPATFELVEGSLAPGLALIPAGNLTGSPTASGAFTFVIEATDAEGCTADREYSLLVCAGASVSAVGPTTFCDGGEVTLTASDGVQFLWSNGATSQSISVIEGGEYSVTVHDANGCVDTSPPVSVVVNPLPIASITPSGPTAFCEGGEVTLTASDGADYLWSNGSTARSIVVSHSGEYSVTVRDANGCSAASVPTSLVANPLPVATIAPSGPTTFCDGGDVTLTASEGSEFLWSNGSTAQSIVVSDSGEYSVTVRDVNGCSAASAPTSVVVNPLPTASIAPWGPTTFCDGGEVTLRATEGAEFLWSNGSTTQSIVVSASGDYSVTVQDANGCSAISAPTSVMVNPLPPASITPSGPTTFCEGSDVTLTASEGVEYLWSSGSTTQSIVVSDNGEYSVTVHDANGCSATSSPTLVMVNSPPTVSITPSGPTTFCDGGQVTLTATDGVEFLWSDGATGQSTIVTAAGDYSVTVHDANGCAATSAPTSVAVNPLPAVGISASGPTRFCAGGSVTLTATDGVEFLWSNGATTQSTQVANGGEFFVTVRDANGCSGTSAPASVVVDTLPVVGISATGPTSFCEGASVTLVASPGGGDYTWSTGNTGDQITVEDSGDYSLVATNQFGCSAPSNVIQVTSSPLPAIPTISTVSSGGVATLTSSPEHAYLWSTGETTRVISTTQSGVYTVTVSTVDQCSATSYPTTVAFGQPNQTTFSGNGVTATFREVQEGAVFSADVITDPSTVAPLPSGYYWIEAPGQVPLAFQLSMEPPAQGKIELAFDVPWELTKRDLKSLVIMHGELDPDTGEVVLLECSPVRYDWDAGTLLGRLTVTVDILSPFVMARVRTPTVDTPVGPVAPLALGMTVSMSATFTDPDMSDLHTATWDWGDSSTSAGTVTEPRVIEGEEIDGSASGEHTYTAPGVYTVRLHIDDNTVEGGIGSADFKYIVVYDPNGGFVTGGGWISSPAGAYLADPTLTGKANFGFVAKYQKGATVPTGTTEFRFNAAGLEFRSSSYQWLVVAGAKAMYKGVGTVNGVAGYGFMISAVDGQITGGGGLDRFRIKIWEVATDQLVYDNQLDAPEDADPTTTLGGGSIVIHK